MSKKNKIENTNNQYATSEKLVEIDLLIRRRELLIRKVITLPSSILAVLTPSILWRYGFGPGAPLSSITDTAVNFIAASYIQEGVSSLNQLEKFQLETIQEYSKFFSETELIANSFNLYGDKALENLVAILDQLSSTEGLMAAASSQLYKDSEFFRVFIMSVTENGIDFFKNRFFNVLSKLVSVAEIDELKEFITKTPINRIAAESMKIVSQLKNDPNGRVYQEFDVMVNSVEICYTSLSLELLNEKFSVLLKYIEESYKKLTEIIRDNSNINFRKSFLDSLSEKSLTIGQLKANKWFLLFAMGAGILVKNFLADRFVGTIYRKLFIEPIPNILNMNIVPSETANKIEEDLKKQIVALEIKAERSVLYARYLSMACIPMLIYMILMAEEFSAEFAIFAFTNLMVAFSGGADYLQQSYADYRLKSHIESKKNLLNGLIKSCGQMEWSEIVNTGIHDSYFAFEASNYQGLSAAVIAGIVKQALYKHGVKIQSSYKSKSKSQITIHADFSISKTKIASINEFINQSIIRQKEFKELKNQINIFVKNLNTSFFSMQLVDSKGLRESKFIVDLENVKNMPDIEKIKVTFTDCKVEFMDDHLTITGCSPIEPNRLRSLCDNLKNSKKSSGKQQLEDEVVDSSLLSNRNPTFRKSKKEDTDQREIKDGKKEIEPAKVIKWKSAKFQPNDDQCKVAPVQSKYFPKNKFYTFFALKKEDFPNEDSYNKFKNKCENPTLARKKSEEGIKFVSRYEKDSAGNVINAAAKLKVLGEYGDIRAYAEEEISPTGEVLYVFKGLDLKSH